MSVKEALEAINKQFGKGAAFLLGKNEALEVDVLPIGIPSIDAILGVGGFPRGRIVEIYGPNSGGKTTLMLHLIAAAQRSGIQAGFIDVEHSLDPAYCKKLGVDTDNLIVSQPDCGEQALEIVNELLKSGDVGIVVLDSVAALVPKAELEGDMGTPQMGLQARLMSQAMRKITASVSKSNCIMVFINQTRDKLGVFYGPSEVTAGGNALKFYASVRLKINRVQSIKVGDNVIGARTKVACVKNKVASPFKETEVDLIFGEGFSKEADTLDFGISKGVVEKSGAWISYKGGRLGQGKENARIFLKEHSEILDQIYQECTESTKSQTVYKEKS